jgi:hypothetical protein
MGHYRPDELTAASYVRQAAPSGHGNTRLAPFEKRVVVGLGVVAVSNTVVIIPSAAVTGAVA